MADAPGREHAPLAADASRDKYAHLYQTTRWTECSRIQRARFPLCEVAGQGCGGLAEIADHFIPAVVYVEMCREKRKFLVPLNAFYDPSNLQSVCRVCHAVKTEEDTRRIATGRPWVELGRPPKKWVF